MTNKFTKLLMTALFCLGGFVLFAQTDDPRDVLKNPKGKIYFARIRPDQTSTLQEAPAFLRTFLDARPGYEFRLKREQTDELGFTHQRYHQYFQGIKIENAEYVVHAKKGVIQTINGDFDNVSVPSVTPKISAADAIKKALAFIPARKYGWEDPFSENLYKKHSNNTTATLYPSPELVIYHDDKITHAYRLVYKIHIYAVQPFGDYNVYVDATTGNIVDKVSLTCMVNTPGTGATLYSGQQNITVDSYNSPTLFRLRETRTGPAGSALIQTLNMQGGSSYANAVEFSNASPDFTAPDAGIDVHWGTERVYDFFNSVMGRNSYNGTGGTLTGYVHAWLPGLDPNLNNDNALWNGTLQVMTYGDGATAFSAVTSLDVVAHEIGHGICQFSAQLGTSGEAPALNEGLSDIWAACVEHWAAPNKNTWQIGEEIMVNGFPCLRSLQNPAQGWPGGSNTRTYADTYKAGNWNNNNDTYTNATVLGHWFFLLSVGGAGTNDLGNAFNVNGITIEQAQRIVYRMETVYMSSGSTYPSTRTAAIEAARDIFGINSCEEEAVTNAWYAVGVGNPYAPTSVNITINGPATICAGGSQTYTIANAPAKARIIWRTTNSATSIAPSADGLSAVVTYNGSGASSTSIIAEYGGCAGLKQVNKFVGLGEPIAALGYVSYTNALVCDLNWFKFLSGGPTRYAYGMHLQVAASGATSYRWSAYPGSDNPNIYWEDLGGGTVSVGAKTSTAGYKYLTCIATNVCGSSSGLYLFTPGVCPALKSSARENTNENVAGNKLTIYPNPVQDNLTITIPVDMLTGRTTIRIMDVYGRQIQRHTNMSTINTIPVSGLSAGIYIVEVYSNNKMIMTKKIVKR
ncbi:MAG TPA: M4 family metallopeptidase [Niastella sp.]